MPVDQMLFSAFAGALARAEQRLAKDAKAMTDGRKRIAKTRALHDVQRLRRALEKDAKADAARGVNNAN